MTFKSGSIWDFHLISVCESLAEFVRLVVDVAESASRDLHGGSVNSNSRTLMLFFVLSFSVAVSSGARRLFSDNLD